MKMFLMLAVTLFGTVSFAGPEDHIQNQSCYSIETADMARAHAELPLEICFESLTVHLADQHSHPEDSIEVYSYFSHYQQYLTGLQLTSLVRATEDQYVYQAENVLVDRNESHCEDAVKITLHMEGMTDFLGYGDVGAQTLTLTQVTSADVCHSNFETNVFKFVRTR